VTNEIMMLQRIIINKQKPFHSNMNASQMQC